MDRAGGPEQGARRLGEKDPLRLRDWEDRPRIGRREYDAAVL
jgi:hypothetical protein